MKKHPYILATIAATLLAIVVWLFIPKEYTAITKISDEYKEVDLAIGLNKRNILIRDAQNAANAGLNDIEVYCKVLKSEDFARKISQKQIDGTNMTYGEYLNQKDTIDVILNNISFNYHNRENTLTIGFSDIDNYIAAQMLDSVTAQLQDFVIRRRHSLAKAAMKAALFRKNETEAKYRTAQKAYAAFSDANNDLKSYKQKEEEEFLRKEVNLAYNNYKESTQQYTRQKALTQRHQPVFAVIQSNTVPQHYNSYFASWLISFIIISLALTKGYLLLQKKNDFIGALNWGNIFSPWAITLILWIVVIIFVQIESDKLYPLTSQFYYGIVLWISIFCITSFLTYNLMERDSGLPSVKPIHINKNIFWFLLVFSLICSPLCVKKSIETVLLFGSNNIMEGLRLLAISGESGWGILDLSFIINKVLLIAAIWRYPKLSVWYIILISLLVLLNAIALMDKGTILFLALSIVFVLYERKVISIKSIFFSGGGIFFLFFILTILRGGTDEAGNDKVGDFTLFDFVALYLLSTPIAFGYMSRPVTNIYGAYTLTLIYLILNKLGGNYPTIDLVMDFVAVPIMTNQYTILQPFFADFGFPGIAFFAFLYGLMTGWAYNKYRNGNGFGTCLYTYLVILLVTQYGQENFFITPVASLRFLLFTLLLTQAKIRFKI